MQHIRGFLKVIADYILFTSFFIAFCAVSMVAQTAYLFHLPVNRPFVLFVFFGSLCSYNFHWYLTPELYSSSSKTAWSITHKNLHLFLFLTALAASVYFGLQLHPYWPWLAAIAIITFLYSAPKLPFKVFQLLKQVAVGKTIFLALVWTHITSILPLIISEAEWTTAYSLYAVNRFFLIYPICILFDYRDRDEDQQQGIKSLVTFLSDKGIDYLFWISMAVFYGSCMFMHAQGFSLSYITALLLPGVIVAFLYQYAKKSTSDYLYHFVLDGLMMFSAVILFLFDVFWK